MPTRRILLFSTACCLMAGSAFSALPKSARSVRSYVLEVGGIDIARIWLAQDIEDGRTSLRFDLENEGLARFFGGERRTSMTAEVVTDGPLPMPLRFDARYQKPDRLREIGLRYDPAGAIRALTLKSQGRDQESEVPPDLQRDTVDPLTALVRVQAWLSRRPGIGEEYVVPVFDGRKRVDVRVRYREGGTDGDRLRLALVGIAGFDGDEETITAPGRPLRWMDLLVDGTAPPLPRRAASEDGRLTLRSEE